MRYNKAQSFCLLAFVMEGKQMKRLLALLFLCLLMTAAVCAAAEEEMDWYQYWTVELGINLGEENGQLEEDTGVRNYVDSDTGTTSAIVGENGDQDAVVWLKEEAGGQNAWFGIDNSRGVFEEGSRFWVRWMNGEKNSQEWNGFYDQFDDEHKRVVENDRLWMFQIGVTNPDGEAFEAFEPDAALYVQLGDDWDEQDLHAAYIKEGVDEAKIVSYTESLRYPEGTDSFAGLMLNHFSPYVIYDEGPIAPDLPRTGDNSLLALWCAMTVAAGAVLMLMRRRAHN